MVRGKSSRWMIPQQSPDIRSIIPMIRYFERNFYSSRVMLEICGPRMVDDTIKYQKFNCFKSATFNCHPINIHLETSGSGMYPYFILSICLCYLLNGSSVVMSEMIGLTQLFWFSIAWDISRIRTICRTSNSLLLNFYQDTSGSGLDSCLLLLICLGLSARQIFGLAQGIWSPLL